MNNLNTRQKGYFRDKSILNHLEGFVALDTHQVYVTIFNDIRYGLRKAQERLLKLHRRGKIDRCKVESGFAYFYQQPGMLEHLIGTNWIRIWMQLNLKSWEVEHCFNYEPDYGVLRADGFMAIKNKVTGKFRFIFVENDRATNGFGKVEKYNKVFADELYSGQWWVKLTDRFPVIFIATTGPKRKKIIEREIERDNLNGLEFKVVILDDLIMEVKNHAYSASQPKEDKKAAEVGCGNCTPNCT